MCVLLAPTWTVINELGGPHLKKITLGCIVNLDGAQCAPYAPYELYKNTSAFNAWCWVDAETPFSTARWERNLSTWSPFSFLGWVFPP